MCTILPQVWTVHRPLSLWMLQLNLSAWRLEEPLSHLSLPYWATGLTSTCTFGWVLCANQKKATNMLPSDRSRQNCLMRESRPCSTSAIFGRGRQWPLELFCGVTLWRGPNRMFSSANTIDVRRVKSTRAPRSLDILNATSWLDNCIKIPIGSATCTTAKYKHEPYYSLG